MRPWSVSPQRPCGGCLGCLPDLPLSVRFVPLMACPYGHLRHFQLHCWCSKPSAQNSLMQPLSTIAGCGWCLRRLPVSRPCTVHSVTKLPWCVRTTESESQNYALQSSAKRKRPTNIVAAPRLTSVVLRSFPVRLLSTNSRSLPSCSPPGPRVVGHSGFTALWREARWPSNLNRFQLSISRSSMAKAA